ncbi:DUF1249 domain-containing protein [Cognatilysobacter lacus]|uniref:DUF1249 domain-containing protein n=1 Tax=Cognatilysobacter lacus TaxID=1643323 RepID=A0A5D8Z507_9GAMM|nr:DUF1249 domain-containing protein [Lysobacter lacus]TZF89841.1 DUF1249 domain-containing protein [Lysobacter lacus]
MTSVAARKRLVPRLGRFAWLMALYAENHGRLARLFDMRDLSEGRWISDIGDGVALRVDVIGQHPYTTEVRLSYAMTDPVTGESDPSAYVRLYHDAKQAEATHCYVGRRWQDVIGLNPTPERLLGHRMQMNTFLGKWLQYLAERGHSTRTLKFEGPLARIERDAIVQDA